MKKEWMVLLSVEYNDMREWRKINEIAEKVDPHAGAGSGFGTRDIDWAKKTEVEAIELKKKLIDAFKKYEFNPRVQVWEEDDEDDPV